MSSSYESFVCVVDDNAGVREALSTLLNVHGIPTQTFATPQVFLDTFDASKCCCLVLDERLPGMTGLQLLDRIPGRGEFPVFMITGHGDARMIAEAQEKGVIKCFQKPFGGNELVSSIQQAICR